jgi:alkanesulfonate monooxygenase SsuD/methylene tetrahydromethanopterin reductase-like flavin-dependent oxidoreductase (luciferase family)
MKFGLLYELALPIDVEASGRTEYEIYWEAIEQVKLAEQMGFEYAWFVEHHFLEDLSRSSAPEVMLAAIAQHTSKIRLGHGVVLMPPPFNHPVRVAERLATLDIVSNGRVEFGGGRSVTMEELGGFNVNPADSRPMMVEALTLIPQLWRERKFKGFEGQYVSFPERVVVPKPVQRPHPPMWLACTSPSTFGMAGEMGLGCLSFSGSDLSELEGWIKQYREAIRHAQPVGDFVNENTAGFTLIHCNLDFDTALHRGGIGGVHHFKRITRYFGEISQQPGYNEYTAKIDERFQLAASQQDPLDRAREMIEGGQLCVGDPDACIRTVKAYERIGLDQILGIVQYSDITHEESMQTIQLMGEHVIPLFRQ